VLKGGPRRATITCRTFDKTASPTPAVILTVPHLEVFAAGHPLFVLNGLTLSEGDICGVTGPSGSGKSSLLTAITMSLPPDRAVGTEDMTLRGRRFEELGGSAWRAGCLTVPQSVPPIPGVTCTEWFRSVLQYAVWSHLDTTAMVEAMEGIAAELLLTRQELNETEISSLSGGERHRAILACALALSPVVLLLDEPTAALDPTSAAAVEAQLVHFAANGTSAVVIVSHDVGLVDRLAHKTVVIGGG
jgi:ABC-type glutathione transport system ATPase component